MQSEGPVVRAKRLLREGSHIGSSSVLALLRPSGVHRVHLNRSHRLLNIAMMVARNSAWPSILLCWITTQY